MKILLTIRGNYIAPRFDQSPEVIIATCYDGLLLEEPRSIILDQISAERICDLVLKEQIALVICGGIEEQHYRFLSWKKIKIFDGVIGPADKVLEAAISDTLKAQTIFPGVRSWGGTP